MWNAIRGWLFPVWCLGCAEPGVALCAACSAGADHGTVELEGLAVRAAATYAGTFREAVLGLKRGERAYLAPLAALLAPLVPAGATLVPLPTTRRRAAERGFDQARELARRVAEIRALPVADVLRKRGRPQHGRSRNARLRYGGRFVLRPGAAVPCEGILLDDVVTTGATLRDAAAALTAAGCRVAGAVVVARTPPGRNTA